MLSGRSLCDGPIPRPEESCEMWCVIVCHLQTSSTRRSWPALGCCAIQKLNLELKSQSYNFVKTRAG